MIQVVKEAVARQDDKVIFHNFYSFANSGASSKFNMRSYNKNRLKQCLNKIRSLKLHNIRVGHAHFARFLFPRIGVELTRTFKADALWFGLVNDFAIPE